MSESPEPPADLSEEQKRVGRVQWWLDTIVAMAPSLRDAGVSSISVDGFSAQLLPAAPPIPDGDVELDDPIPDGIDALHDPRSYIGGVVPGYPRIDRPDPEE